MTTDWSTKPPPWNRIGPAFRAECERIVRQPPEKQGRKTDGDRKFPLTNAQRFREIAVISQNRGWWTIDDIRPRLAEASLTLRRLPWPTSGLPTQLRAVWPDVVHDWLAFGYNPTKIGRIAPTNWEISRMDEALGWLHWLTRDQRLVLWGRANHWSWAKLVALDELEQNGKGRSERQLRRILGDAEARILSHLNGTPPRLVVTLPDAQVAR